MKKAPGRPPELIVDMQRWIVYFLRDFLECSNALVTEIMNQGRTEKDPLWHTPIRYKQMYRETRKYMREHPEVRQSYERWLSDPNMPAVSPEITQIARNAVALAAKHSSRRGATTPAPILQALNLMGLKVQNGIVVNKNESSTIH